ncbi:hypothetical protein PUNSTDRAFT_120854, partial [Punctularia strigosozonata HHB-11173 SS5]|uniref:uncharacterized protein n=1 Tax=Punctularia strigosozonata (strain HHB-11173) TaxID=741275 RepID=UPI0004417149
MELTMLPIDVTLRLRTSVHVEKNHALSTLLDARYYDMSCACDAMGQRDGVNSYTMTSYGIPRRGGLSCQIYTVCYVLLARALYIDLASDVSQ